MKPMKWIRKASDHLNSPPVAPGIACILASSATVLDGVGMARVTITIDQNPVNQENKLHQFNWVDVDPGTSHRSYFHLQMQH